MALFLEVEPEVAAGLLRGDLRLVILVGGGDVPARLSGSIPLVLPLPCSMWASAALPPSPPPEPAIRTTIPTTTNEADEAGADVGEHQPPLGLFRPRRLPLLAHLAQPFPLFLPAISHDLSAEV